MGLRIAFLTPRFHPQAGGAETYTRYLLEGLAARGHEVEVISGAGPSLPEDARIDGLHVRRPGPTRGEETLGRVRWLPGFARSAVRILEETRPDAVFAQYSALAPADWYASRAGTPLVALAHDVYRLSEHLRTRGVLAAAGRYVANERLLASVRPDAVLTVSETMARAIRRLVRAPVIVAGPGVEHVPDSPDPAPGARQVVFVGRLQRSKGPADAALAVSQARDRVPDATLLCVGTGPEARRLPPWVRVVSYLDDDALDAEVRRSALLILPSLLEGWGLVLCEASARGLPYVAYGIPAVREQHTAIGGGMLVEPEDIPGLSRAIEILLTDDAYRLRLGREGREAVRDRLRWSRSAEVAEEVLLRSVARRRGPVPKGA